MSPQPNYSSIADDLIRRACGSEWLPDDPQHPNYDTFLGLMGDISHHLEMGRIVVLQKTPIGFELRAYETSLAKSHQTQSLYDLRKE